MKHFYKKFKIACLVTLLLAGMSNVMAQREVNVSPGSLLNEAIHGDTTAQGDRVDSNTVYILERGQVYEISSYIRIGVPLQIKSAAGDGAPAIIVTKSDGTTWPQAIRTRGDVWLEDIYLSNANGEGSQPRWGGFRTEADSVTVVLKKCLIEMDKASALQVRGHGQRILIEDCVIGKMGDFNRNNGNGRLVDCRTYDVEKIEVRNTTMYHLADRIIKNMDGNKIDTLIFNQNTGIQIQGYHGLFHLGVIGYAKITNNLFLNPKYMGNHTNLNEQTGPAPDNQNHYLVTADTILAETKFMISNNNFFYDEDVIAFFGRYDTVSKAEVLAPIVATKMGDDASNAGWEYSFTFDNPVPTINFDYLDGLFTDPTADPTPENWPMPDGITIFNFNGDFSTTNSELITGSTEGEQLGDLNWKGTLIPSSISQKGMNSIGIKVYPNPVNDYLTVEFLDSKSNASIALFDVTGKQVKEIPQVSVGHQRVEMPVMELPAGLYFYSVKSSEGIATGKVTISR